MQVTVPHAYEIRSCDLALHFYRSHAIGVGPLPVEPGSVEEGGITAGRADATRER